MKSPDRLRGTSAEDQVPNVIGRGSSEGTGYLGLTICFMITYFIVTPPPLFPHLLENCPLKAPSEGGGVCHDMQS